MEPKVSIRDSASLDELVKAQKFASDSMLKLLDHISKYFDSMIESMEAQTKFLEERVKEAKEQLDEAEDAYRVCLDSQEYDEEYKCYYPSCDIEYSFVSQCRERYYDLQRREQEAYNILNESKGEVELYHESGGFITPPGAEVYIKFLACEQTDAACQKMESIKASFSEYRSVSTGIRNSKNSSAEKENAKKEILEKEELIEKENEEEKGRMFRAASDSIRLDQASNNSKTADAVAECEDCGRAVTVCICAHIK